MLGLFLRMMEPQGYNSSPSLLSPPLPPPPPPSSPPQPPILLLPPSGVEQSLAVGYGAPPVGLSVHKAYFLWFSVSHTGFVFVIEWKDSLVLRVF